MSRSIMQKNRLCYVCGSSQNLQSHHIFYGTRNRSKAEKDGLKVFLCWEHHEGTYGVHGREGHELDERLKQVAEQIWIKHFDKTEDDFRERYGKNYL